MEAIRSFAQLRTDIFNLHGQGKYSEALALLDQEARAFPEEASATTYWRICLFARSGDAGAALKAMAEAVGTGWWRAERILRGDPDLTGLHGVREFERLVEACRAREQAAQVDVKPTLATFVPKVDPGRDGYPLLIALHGFGGNVADFAPFWGRVPMQGWLVALPQATHVVDREGYAWRDRDVAAREMEAHYVALCGGYRINRSRVVLAGFSQGAGLATWLALRNSPIKAMGVLAVTPGVRDLDAIAPLAKAHGGHLRIYLIMGTRDFAYERVRDFARVLQSTRIPIIVDERVGLDHEMPADFDETVARAFDFIAGRDGR